MNPNWPVLIHPSWAFPQRRTAQSHEFEGNTSSAAAEPGLTFGKNLKNSTGCAAKRVKSRVNPDCLTLRTFPSLLPQVSELGAESP